MRRVSRARRQRSRILIFVTILALSVALLVAFRTIAKPSRLIDKLDINYVILDMSRGKYQVIPSIDSKSFSYLIKQLKPCAAITGTYFGFDAKPLGDILANGKVINRGFQRQGIGFKKDGRIIFIERIGRSKLNWSGCYAGVSCGPRLVRSGRKDLNYKRDGFKPGAAAIEARRCAIGATKDGKLILCIVNDWITLNILADAMLELGAQDAINMDGGSMCAFYANGKCYIEPGRPMNNIIGIYEKRVRP